MSFRVLPKRLSRPAAHVGSATSTLSSSTSSSSGTAPSPLLQFPAFHPAPFQHDKFLSIKTRSLETYTKLRSDVLQRSAELRTQLQRNQERAKRRSGAAADETATTTSLHIEAAHTSSSLSAASVEVPPLPLTPPQAEELLLLSKKVESLTEFQGLVLSDELAWRMFHLCVECGAPRQAIDNWLRKHLLAEHRGPPYPLFLLKDLATVLRTSVLSRLPESGASLSCSSSLLLSDEADGRGGLVGLEDGLVAAQRFLQLYRVHRVHDDAEGAALDDNHSRPGELYAAHLIHDYVWPVWRSLEAMQLTLETLKGQKELADEDQCVENEEESNEIGVDRNAAEGEGGSESGSESVTHSFRRSAATAGITCWCPDVAEQAKAVRSTLMSVSPLYSFHQTALKSAASLATHAKAGGKGEEAASAKSMSSRAHTLLAYSPPSFDTEVEAVVAPLRALLDVWLAVAQCASEAKDTRLLHEVQHTLCVGFLCCSAPDVHKTDAAVQQTVLACSLNEAAWCRYGAILSSAFSSGASRLAGEAEAHARAVVHSFLADTLSVVQYGLLCVEQEQALWQLHDTSALICGGAAMLKRLRGADPSSNFAADSVDVDSASRRLQALAVAQHQTAEEEERNLLCDALPRALRGTVHSRSERVADKAMRKSVHAFLSQTLEASSAAANGEDAAPLMASNTALSYADAGMYVGVAMGDATLLQQAAAAAAMSESDAAVMRLLSQLLLRYRRAVVRLRSADDDAPETAEAADAAISDASGEVWTRIAALREGNSIADSDAGEGTSSAAQQLDGCLQAILLETARRQVECAAAYVRAVHPHGRDPDESPNSDEEGGENAEESPGEDGAAQRAFHSAETEEARLEAVAQAWTHLHEVSTRNVVEALEQVAMLLSKARCCLSPSALSSLSVLGRLGIYLEQEMRTPTSSTPSSVPSCSLTSSLDSIIARLTGDSCALLQHALSSPSPLCTPSIPAASGPTTAMVGTWVQWVLIALMNRGDWSGVLAVLKSLDGLVEEPRSSGTVNSNASASLLCSTTVDPAVFATLYNRAQEDGAARVCAFLRPRRESLFF
ncbi:hypothetical protein ABB37_03814 [Leptomonas pyrrhocoris]|uniref:Uncharacterized protein n=1 Tax=Leptomonas pyrrhocoris TaxID=157538 RepID=A0A0N0DW81_LEPPY|nr:hypothetical protein ABB37_03814 [Leptomonas pyrrhocoris]KPA81448.1 hypothetical protein ABB37_03814 [Leptomonas pyrrhocoris]|eukprot:XP_015659887.1 hypothetical protein ABB37_03814 [Leptomonas pyrrhocoris]